MGKNDFDAEDAGYSREELRNIIDQMGPNDRAAVEPKEPHVCTTCAGGPTGPLLEPWGGPLEVLGALFFSGLFSLDVTAGVAAVISQSVNSTSGSGRIILGRSGITDTDATTGWPAALTATKTNALKGGTFRCDQRGRWVAASVGSGWFNSVGAPTANSGLLRYGWGSVAAPHAIMVDAIVDQIIAHCSAELELGQMGQKYPLGPLANWTLGFPGAGARGGSIVHAPLSLKSVHHPFRRGIPLPRDFGGSQTTVTVTVDEAWSMELSPALAYFAAGTESGRLNVPIEIHIGAAPTILPRGPCYFGP